MIRDWLSRVVGAVVGGPLILLVPPAAVFAAVAGVDELLLRTGRRRARARVRAATDQVTGRHVKRLVPSQRDGER